MARGGPPRGRNVEATNIESTVPALSAVLARVRELVIIADTSSRLYGVYILSFLAIGAWLYWKGERTVLPTPSPARPEGQAPNLLGYLLPRSVFLHASSRVDIGVYLLNGLLGGVLNLATLVLSTTWVADAMLASLVLVTGHAGFDWQTGVLSTLVFSVGFVLLVDLGLFLAHYAHHRVPLLWTFHKVHHSATVLTPVTAFRFHPVDVVITGACVAVVVGPWLGLFRFLFESELGAGVPVAYGVATVLFLLTANFRHSHIPVHYPRGLTRFLVSPAMHHVHHSTDPRHFDRNFGFMFSVWDRVAGTAVVPARGEALTFGMGEKEDARFATVMSCYIEPFRQVLRRVKRRKASSAGVSSMPRE